VVSALSSKSLTFYPVAGSRVDKAIIHRTGINLFQAAERRTAPRLARGPGQGTLTVRVSSRRPQDTKLGREPFS
jgi:hypothetical protein